MSATYEIKPVTDNRISLAPESEVAEILQNVQTIISTVRGSVPLDGMNHVPKLVIYHLPPHKMGR